MTVSNEKKIVKRKIIEIDEDLCTGCGKCVISCAEGALEIVDGKAKVISDVFCDGLGACIGECPEGALRIIEREAAQFDEEAVEDHLDNLNKIKEKDTTNVKSGDHSSQCTCQSATTMVLGGSWEETDISEDIPSALRQWPTKLKLVSPTAPYFRNEELVIISDCAPLAFGDFHRKILRGKPIVTLCPMLSLDENDLEKLTEILQLNPIKNIHLILMEVSCCQKIKLFIDPIINSVGRPIEVYETIISREGEILRETKI